MIGNISLMSYGAAALCYLVLCVMLLRQWRVPPLGPALFCAAAATFAWSAIIALGTLLPYPPITLMQAGELLRDLCWLFFLLQLLGFQEDGRVMSWLGRRWLPPFILLALLCAAAVALRPLAGGVLPLSRGAATELATMLSLVLAVAGLLLVEQVFRNAEAAERWAIKFLCLSLGGAFAYDLFMYAQALLFRQLNTELWQARGLVTVLLLPWLLLAIARNRNWRVDVHLSRQVVFHSVTLMGAGLYLLCMAAIGYLISLSGGAWGGVLQIGFLAGAATLLITLLFSGSLRARLRVFVAKNFFSYRYDYREQWLRFTQDLAASGQQSGEAIIRAMADIVHSRGGVLIHRGSDQRLDEVVTVNWLAPRVGELAELERWILETGWVIDIDEWSVSPQVYQHLNLPRWLTEVPELWLVVPLLFEDQLEGLLLLPRSTLRRRVNWEDRDLLKTAGRQAAALLAQQRASQALVEARQFDAFNRLSAYVIHDLKNILAQQSMMVSNARKHRDNPAFIDDMIATVENSVQRMQRLMEQMRSELRDGQSEVLALTPLLERVVERHCERQPVPTLRVEADLQVRAGRERLATVFGHLLQNAQEATADDGVVELRVREADGNAEITVRDSGSGMSETFVRERLFKPFDSTKGLTGMGIGAFESREYLRQLGGDIRVASTPGEGSCFTVTLPLSAGSTAAQGSESPAVAALPANAGDCDANTPTAAPRMAN